MIKVPVLHLLLTPESQNLCGVFKGYKMGTSAINGLIKVSNDILSVKIFSNTTQKMKFSIKNFFSKCDQIWKQETADLVAFAEEILNGKLHFACIKSE